MFALCVFFGSSVHFRGGALGKCLALYIFLGSVHF